MDLDATGDAARTDQAFRDFLTAVVPPPASDPGGQGIGPEHGEQGERIGAR